MQNYKEINGNDYVKDSRTTINETMRSIQSMNSGTVFPTTNLFEGMKCYRTDLKKTYTLTDVANNTWAEDDTASKLSTARKINITGNATGAADFDGTGDININVNVNESKHANDVTDAVINYGASGTDNKATAMASGVIDNLDSLTGSNDLTSMDKLRSFVGTVYNSDWYDVISVRHRNSAGDGKYYGLLMYSNVFGGSINYKKQSTYNGWTEERTLLDSSNYNSYAPTKTGGGASGTWPISISGKAAGLSGDLVFPEISSIGASRRIHWGGSTDGADIYYQINAPDQGNLVLNLTDDDNCYLRIACNGAFKSYFSPRDGNFHGNVNGNADTATKANDSDKLGGHPLAASGDGGHYGAIPLVRSDGVMEVGKYIDWHATNGGTGDYSSRWEAETNGTVSVGTINGTLKGNADTATNADTVDGYHASDIINRITAANTGGIVAASLTENGYVKFANGLILQWGNAANPVKFPIAFPTATLNVVATLQADGDGGNMSKNRLYIQTLTTTDFTIQNPQGTYRYYAVGI